jgi:hypothetical protein
MASSGMLRRVVLVRTDVSEERVFSIFKVKRMNELGTTLAVTIKPANAKARTELDTENKYCSYSN